MSRAGGVEEERTVKALETATRGAARRKAGRRPAAFSRRQRLDLQPIQVNELLEGTQDLLGRYSEGMVQVSIRPGHDVWKAVADPGQWSLRY